VAIWTVFDLSLLSSLCPLLASRDEKLPVTSIPMGHFLKLDTLRAA
jgi:hypothetical protein